MSAPASVLFVCHMNAVRSPMAAALLKKLSDGKIYAESCGLEPGYLDDFMVTVMQEIGVDMSDHSPQTLRDLQDANFDQVICLTESAYDAALAVFKDDSAEVIHWPIVDPTQGSLDVRAILNSYRNVRQLLSNRIERAFLNAS